MKPEISNNTDLGEYKNHICQIIVEKRRKHQDLYEYLSGTVETVDNRCLCLLDSKNSLLKIPIVSIRGIQALDK
jgi:hypothetical protein